MGTAEFRPGGSGVGDGNGTVRFDNVAPGRWEISMSCGASDMRVGPAKQFRPDVESDEVFSFLSDVSISDCGMASLMLSVLRRFGYDGPIKDIFLGKTGLRPYEVLMQRLEALEHEFDGDSGPQCGVGAAIEIVKEELGISP